MADFESAVNRLLKSEGGYVNDKTDRGGETKYGISKRAYPGENIKELTAERAKELYKRDYWDKLNLDSEADDGLAYVIFDTAVNSGAVFAKGLYDALPSGADVSLYRQSAVTLARIARVAKLCEKKPEQKKYLFGWVMRYLKVLGGE